MPRGVFTQSTTILFERAPAIDDVARVLSSWKPARVKNPSPSWLRAKDELLVRFDEKNNGTVLIDVLGSRWPDKMNNPEHDPDLFGAWGLGAFGPLVFPGNLERAAMQAVAFPGAKDMVTRHRAFVRLRTSYVVGAGGDAKVIPADWQTLAEIDTLLSLARRVMDLPHALALFDPNGEVILPRDEVDAVLDHARAKSIPPMELLTHVRLFRLAGEQGMLMDTVGMDRFMLRDSEIVIAPGVDPNDGAAFLRNISLQHVRRGSITPEGNTVDGPNGRYTATWVEKSMVPAPRAVVRFAKGS